MVQLLKEEQRRKDFLETTHLELLRRFAQSNPIDPVMGSTELNVDKPRCCEAFCKQTEKVTANLEARDAKNKAVKEQMAAKAAAALREPDVFSEPESSQPVAAPASVSTEQLDSAQPDAASMPPSVSLAQVTALAPVQPRGAVSAPVQPPPQPATASAPVKSTEQELMDTVNAMTAQPTAASSPVKSTEQLMLEALNEIFPAASAQQAGTVSVPVQPVTASVETSQMKVDLTSISGQWIGNLDEAIKENLRRRWEDQCQR